MAYGIFSNSRMWKWNMNANLRTLYWILSNDFRGTQTWRSIKIWYGWFSNYHATVYRGMIIPTEWFLFPIDTIISSTALDTVILVLIFEHRYDRMINSELDTIPRITFTYLIGSCRIVFDSWPALHSLANVVISPAYQIIMNSRSVSEMGVTSWHKIQTIDWQIDYQSQSRRRGKQQGERETRRERPRKGSSGWSEERKTPTKCPNWGSN